MNCPRPTTATSLKIELGGSEGCNPFADGKRVVWAPSPVHNAYMNRTVAQRITAACDELSCEWRLIHNVVRIASAVRTL